MPPPSLTLKLKAVIVIVYLFVGIRKEIKGLAIWRCFVFEWRKAAVCVEDCFNFLVEKSIVTSIICGMSPIGNCLRLSQSAETLFLSKEFHERCVVFWSFRRDSNWICTPFHYNFWIPWYGVHRVMDPRRACSINFSINSVKDLKKMKVNKHKIEISCFTTWANKPPRGLKSGTSNHGDIRVGF